MAIRESNESEMKTLITDFPGLVVDGAAEDIPPGAAQVQTNCMSDIIGKLRSRWGVTEVKFEEEN